MHGLSRDNRQDWMYMFASISSHWLKKDSISPKVWILRAHPLKCINLPWHFMYDTHEVALWLSSLLVCFEMLHYKQDISKIITPFWCTLGMNGSILRYQAESWYFMVMMRICVYGLKCYIAKRYLWLHNCITEVLKYFKRKNICFTI